jgi:hypothetical protein
VISAVVLNGSLNQVQERSDILEADRSRSKGSGAGQVWFGLHVAHSDPGFARVERLRTR